MTNKKCNIENCNTRPTYNFKSQPSKFCKTHAQPGMIDVTHKKCEYDNCNTRPTYGLEKNKPTRCKKHKLDNMYDVCNILCIFENCTHQPTYGFINEKPIYCNTHKLDNMIDVRSLKCEYSKCNKQPKFNYQTENRPRFCKSHAQDGMIDINSKKCESLNCRIRPSFGYMNAKPQFCVIHKLENMVNLLEPICKYTICNTQASYNFKGKKVPLYCCEHKLSDMINISAKYCQGINEIDGCPFNHVGNKKYDFYCTQCFAHKFSTDKRTALINNRSDELKTMYFVNKEFPTLNFIHDKPLWIDNCNCEHKRRVDLRKLIGNTILAIEIDEKQHKSKEYSDETTRYDDLYMIHSGKWIFIRFNPDSFKNNVNKRRNPPLTERFNILKQEINKQLERIRSEENDTFVKISYLFYDGYTY